MRDGRLRLVVQRICPAERQPCIDTVALQDQHLREVALLRNVTIQRTAEGLKQIANLYTTQRYQEAWGIAYRLEQDLRRVARLTNENQMVQDADMMRKYEDTLSKWVQKQTDRSPQTPLPSSGGVASDPPIRGREATPYPVPTIEIR
jgi:hypothetical protein